MAASQLLQQSAVVRVSHSCGPGGGAGGAQTNSPRYDGFEGIVVCALGRGHRGLRFDGDRPCSVRASNLAHYLLEGMRAGSFDGILGGGLSNARGLQFVAQQRSGRSALYGDAETYVLMEPGEDEQFVTAEELQERLKNWLQEWPGEELPVDLAKFPTLDEAVQYLLNAVCELDLGDGQGSIQWFEVRLD